MTTQPNPPTANLPWEKIRELYLRHAVAGESLEKLARELACNAEALGRDLKQAGVRVRAEFAVGSIKELRLQHTVRLEEIFHKALEGYDRSCDDEVTHKRTAQGEQAGELSDEARPQGTASLPKLRVETVTRRKAGNARFLWEARSALSDIRRMWTGPSARKKQADEAQDDSQESLESASDEELATLCAAETVLKRLAARKSGGGANAEDVVEFDADEVADELEA